MVIVIWIVLIGITVSTDLFRSKGGIIRGKNATVFNNDRLGGPVPVTGREVFDLSNW